LLALREGCHTLNEEASLELSITTLGSVALGAINDLEITRANLHAVDAFLEHQGIENNFTDDELLYLGVLLKQRNYSHVVNVIRQGDIRAAYLREVTPMIDGTMFLDIPEYVIPMWLYPTAASAALFHRGQEFGPTLRLMTVSIAGFADAARTMNASLSLLAEHFLNRVDWWCILP